MNSRDEYVERRLHDFHFPRHPNTLQQFKRGLPVVPSDIAAPDCNKFLDGH